MCEIDGVEPLFGWARGKQHHQFGFLGAFSLLLSFSVKRKLRKETGQAKEPSLSGRARRLRQKILIPKRAEILLLRNY
jgi:hypothetical protein